MTYIKFGLFGLSTLGFFQLIRRLTKDKIDLFFLPALTIAVQITILFFAGIINLLPEMSTLLYLTGLIALSVSVWKSKSPGFVKDYFNDGYILFFVIMIVMGLRVRGKLFSHYDDFSHWALVVRHLLEANRFPSFESSLITYQEYPLGSAIYIYFFSKMISPGEPVQMLAQIYMTVAAVFPLFSFADKRSVRLDLVFVCIVYFMFLYNIKAGELLVDTLLPGVGACALLFAKKYCREESPKSHFWLLSCFLVQLIQTKNSGVFFVAATILVSVRQYWNKQNRLNNLCAALFPFLSLATWKTHCKYAFPAAAYSKHAMTLENYRSIFGGKTAEEIKTICTGLLRLSITSKDVLLLLGTALLIGCCIWFFNKNARKDFRICFLFSLILFICYQLGTLGMYLFSMPGEEALRLAGSGRYLKTIIIAVLLINTAFAIHAFSNIKISERIKTVAAAIILICILSFSYITQKKIYLLPTIANNSEERIWIEKQRGLFSVPMYDSYCILIPKQDSGYSYYLLKYVFQSKYVSYKVVEKRVDLNDISSNYIFVYDKENAVIDTWIREMYPDQAGNDVIIRRA